MACGRKVALASKDASIQTKLEGENCDFCDMLGVSKMQIKALAPPPQESWNLKLGGTPI